MPRYSLRALPIVLAGALCIASAAAEDVYKWTDANGVTHYADAPPSGIKYEKLNVRTVTTASATEETKTLSPEDAAAKTAADTAALNEKSLSSGCRQARANLEILQSNAIVRKDVDGDGVPEDVSGAQLEKEVKNAEKLVAGFCG